ncbi:MAG: ATP-binding cassette domain-containing protein [Corynebacterium sp.]|nr:ATP-binding cassette domain-containing protein [Corynebacterium sp.]
MSLIQIRDLRKVYPAADGAVRALDGLNLDVERGTVRGLLGPNGAGKTTTVKVLTTLIKPTSGEAFVDGINVAEHPNKVRQMIGASGQYATIDEKLTARENLVMIGRLFHLGDAAAKSRADELLEIFNLDKAANRPIKGFSGGMRRRADLAASLVNDPQILFLDEPTTGLDPAARLALWDVIRERVRQGTTLLLTTQYLEEADALADRISVIDHGTVIAEGTSDELKSTTGGQRVYVSLVDEADVAIAQSILAQVALPETTVITDARSVSVQVNDGPEALLRVMAEIKNRGLAVHDAGLARPTLDDVFLQLTGGKAGDGR